MPSPTPESILADAARGAANAATVRLMYDCERRRDLETWITLWHPDGRQTFPFGDGSNDVVGIEALRASTADKFATRGAMTIVDEVVAMADPRWVFSCVDVSIEFTSLGRTLETTLWCRFEFADDGRILVHEEVLDTALAARVFAPD